MCLSYIDPRSLAEAVGASLPRQISDARAVQLVFQLAVSKKNESISANVS